MNQDVKTINKNENIAIVSLTLFASFFFFFFSSMDLYLQNIGDFSFYLKDIVLCFLGVTIGFIFLLLLFFFLLRKLNRTLFKAFFLLFAGLVFAAYMQGTFLNIGIAALDNADQTVWSTQLRPMAKNLLIWFVMISLPLFLYAFFKNKTYTILTALSALLLIMQIGGTVSTLISTPLNKEIITSSRDDQFTLSDSNNIICFISDSFGTEYVDEILEKEPEFLDFLDGFTYYPNMVASYRKTHGSISFLMNGEYYLNNIPFGVYLENAAEKDTFWEDLQGLGYHNRLYINKNSLFVEEHMKYIDNLYKVHPTITNKTRVTYQLTKLSFYRNLPILFRPFLFADYATLVKSSISLVNAESSPAICDDALFNKEILENHITLSNTENLLSLYYLPGAHIPLQRNRYAENVEKGDTSFYEQALGSLTTMKNMIAEMKENGIYDDATIIITSDHGSETGNLEIKDKPVSPILFLKLPNENHELTISQAPVAHEDIRPTIIKAAGGDYEKYGTPIELWDIDEKDRIRKHYRYVWGAFPTYNSYFNEIFEYEVIGNAQDPNNYSLTGTTYLPKGVVNN